VSIPLAEEIEMFKAAFAEQHPQPDGWPETIFANSRKRVYPRMVLKWMDA
jgi:hypothetical protein